MRGGGDVIPIHECGDRRVRTVDGRMHGKCALPRVGDGEACRMLTCIVGHAIQRQRAIRPWQRGFGNQL